MTNTAKSEERHTKRRNYNIDEDETLREVGEDRDLIDYEDEPDAAADRRRDPLRMPH